MAELEIHHEVEGEHDSLGMKIGVIAAIIGVLLAFDTIASHRAHTEAVVKKTEANDEWAYYQSKSIKRVQYKMGAEILVLSPNSAATVEQFKKEEARYEKESEESKTKAQEIEAETRIIESEAFRYDIGEGLLELGLIMTSLYFISRKKLLPIIGVLSAAAGTVIGASALLIK